MISQKTDIAHVAKCQLLVKSSEGYKGINYNILEHFLRDLMFENKRWILVTTRPFQCQESAEDPGLLGCRWTPVLWKVAVGDVSPQHACPHDLFAITGKSLPPGAERHQPFLKLKLQVIEVVTRYFHTKDLWWHRAVGLLPVIGKLQWNWLNCNCC